MNKELPKQIQVAIEAEAKKLNLTPEHRSAFVGIAAYGYLLAQRENSVESEFVDELLQMFEAIGIDTSMWEYNFGDGNSASEFIQAGIKDHLESLSQKEETKELQPEYVYVSSEESTNYVLFEGGRLKGYLEKTPLSTLLAGEDKWISVEDKLPEESGYYLAHDTNYDKQNGFEIYRYDNYNQSWYFGADCYHPQFWKFLPPHPSKEDKRIKEAPADKRKIVCYCGSLRVAMDAFKKAEYEAVLKGEIALLPCCMFVDIEREYGAESDYKTKADDLHKRKIDIADEVFILNVGGYIGQSTRSELEYAKSIDKPIKYLEPVDQAKEAPASGGVEQTAEEHTMDNILKKFGVEENCVASDSKASPSVVSLTAPSGNSIEQDNTRGDWAKCRCDNQYHYCFVHHKWGRKEDDIYAPQEQHPHQELFDLYNSLKEQIGELGYNKFIHSKEVEEYRAWLRNDKYKHRIEWFEKKFPNGLYYKDDDGSEYGINILTKQFLAEADAAWLNSDKNDERNATQQKPNSSNTAGNKTIEEEPSQPAKGVEAIENDISEILYDEIQGGYEGSIEGRPEAAKIISEYIKKLIQR